MEREIEKEIDTKLIKEYSGLKHRSAMLENGIRLDKGQQENDVAQRLLKKIQKRISKFEKDHPDIKLNYEKYEPKEEATYQSSGDDNWREGKMKKFSEENLCKELGIIYLIFGREYCTNINYHNYRVEFLRNAPKENGAFARVYANIFEDDQRICTNVIIGFWPYWREDTVNDMEFATEERNSINRYENTFLYKAILKEMKILWNKYANEDNDFPRNMFRPAPYDLLSKPKESSDKEKSLIIKAVEKEILSGINKKSIIINDRVIVWYKKNYSSLEDLLKNSGVLYKVENNQVYIFNKNNNMYSRLIGIEKNSNDIKCYFLFYSRWEVL